MLQNKKSRHSGLDVQDFCLLPVIFSATESFLNKENIKETVYSAQAPFWQNITPIVTAVTNAQSDFSWHVINNEEWGAIKKEFIALLEKEPIDQRESGEIMRLFDQTQWEVLKK
jgi:hypothetical protein